VPIIQNGDFSDGLTGWTVSDPAGPTAPTLDEENQRVIFGRADNDVQNGDFLQQTVALTQGNEYTLSFSMAEIGDSPFAGFGLTVDLVRVLEDGTVTTDTQSLGSFQVGVDETNNVTVTFNSLFDDALLRIRGQFGFGTMESVLVLDDFVLTCFTAGTMIDTPQGPRAIEELRAGDLVNTLDHGPCPLRLVTSRRVSEAELAMRPEWRPVVIEADCFGPGAPCADLVVSPAHRILLEGYKVNLMFGEEQVFAPANAMAGHVEGCRRLTKSGPVTYYHLLFDTHQIVVSNGLHTESFHPSVKSVSATDAQTRREIMALFPHLEQDEAAYPSARQTIKAYECRVLTR